MSDELRFDGRVAIVTGAAQGLGRAYAHLLAARGAAVVVNDLGGPVDGAPGTSSAAEQAAAEIRAAGGTACADAHSVATAEGAAAIVATALEAFGRIDILINNAGIINAAPFAEMPFEQFEQLLAVHLGGAFRVSQAVWPHLAAQRYGRILLTSSVGGMFGFPALAGHYASAKAAMLGLMNTLGKEGEAVGIQVNTIAPGGATRMVTDQVPEAVAAWFAEHMAVEQVAPVAAWLVHEDCELSGRIWSAAGGSVARLLLVETIGYRSDHLTIEEVRDHVAEIEDERDYLVPTWHNRFELMKAHLGTEPPTG